LERTNRNNSGKAISCSVCPLNIYNERVVVEIEGIMKNTFNALKVKFYLFFVLPDNSKAGLLN